MNLEKKFEERYGKKEYERKFSGDFRQAIRDMDKMKEVLSNSNEENGNKDGI